MTAAIAKTEHRREWRTIHQYGCQILHINPNQEFDRFEKMAQFISDFTDAHHTPPRTVDFKQLAV